MICGHLFNIFLRLNLYGVPVRSTPQFPAIPNGRRARFRKQPPSRLLSISSSRLWIFFAGRSPTSKSNRKVFSDRCVLQYFFEGSLHQPGPLNCELLHLPLYKFSGSLCCTRSNTRITRERLSCLKSVEFLFLSPFQPLLRLPSI